MKAMSKTALSKTVKDRKRILSLWLPQWPTDRLYRAWQRTSDEGQPGRDRPLALIMAQQGGQRIGAANMLGHPAVRFRRIGAGDELPATFADQLRDAAMLAEPRRGGDDHRFTIGHQISSYFLRMASICLSCSGSGSSAGWRDAPTELSMTQSARFTSAGGYPSL